MSDAAKPEPADVVIADGVGWTKLAIVAAVLHRDMDEVAERVAQGVLTALDSAGYDIVQRDQ